MITKDSASDANAMPSQIASRSHKSIPDWRRYLPSSTSTFILIFFIVGLLMNGFFRPYKRGFFCNDTTIQYPFKADTVSFKALLVIALFIPWIVIRQLERRLIQLINSTQGRPRSRSNQYENGSKVEEEELMAADERIKRRLVVNVNDSDVESSAINQADEIVCDNEGEDAVKMPSANITPGEVRLLTKLRRTISTATFSDVQVFLFGFATTSFLTGIGKITCGRYRPHFMQRCQPNIDCSLQSNMFRYIEDYKCTNKSLMPKDHTYIATSWPSGHAAIAFYSMLYLIYYANSAIPVIGRFKSINRKQRKLSPLLVHSAYVLMISLAVFISLTRVSDYHHHPTDVLSGIIIGVVVALAFAGHVFKPSLERAQPLALR